jgi:hypothetical protein
MEMSRCHFEKNTSGILFHGKFMTVSELIFPESSGFSIKNDIVIVSSGIGILGTGVGDELLSAGVPVGLDGH